MNSSLVTVRVNGEDLTFEDPEALPKIINDRTMLSARAFYEKIGAKVDWNGKDKSVTVTKGSDKIVLTIGADKALVNDKEVVLDSPATIIGEKTYIPVRFVSEAFGYKVKYDANEGMPIVDIFNITEKELETKLQELEKEEIITKNGRKYIVCASNEKINWLKVEILHEYISDFMDNISSIGMTVDEAIEILQQRNQANG